MVFAGVIPLSLVDYPGHPAVTVFTAGCPLRCGYCHNPSLVRGPYGPGVDESRVLDFLRRRQGMLRHLCVTGGEPTLHRELGPFLAAVREMGFAVKLDTAGSRPQALADLLRAGLLDYVAMDVKTAWERYGEVGAHDPRPFQASAALIRALAPDYEFRTTAAPGLVEHVDVLAIAGSLRGARRYALQAFRPRGPLLDPAWEQRQPHPVATLQAWAAELQGWFLEPVLVRAAAASPEPAAQA